MEEHTRPAVVSAIPDRVARRTALAMAAIAVACLVVPGMIAIIERPDNAREGYLAVTVGVTALTWQLVLALRAAVVVTPEAIGRRWLREHLIRWDDVDVVRFDGTRVPYGHGRSAQVLHHLVVDHGHHATRLTRKPLRDADRARLQQHLRRAGVRWQT